ncbi:hypothetical protein B6N60_00274 [Richelia sinica FACHB-800]|uniref:Uncharacterized protein n=1 Tax=Richelia sinica FACHB-800 TaxID=1357546 RepID=A0A975Y312_9NOST|nr:hypothetical protein B6N60_00274 [Richelia sinica FACHB-800]
MEKCNYFLIFLIILNLVNLSCGSWLNTMSKFTRG